MPTLEGHLQEGAEFTQIMRNSVAVAAENKKDLHSRLGKIGAERPTYRELRRSCDGGDHLAYTLKSRQVASTTPLTY